MTTFIQATSLLGVYALAKVLVLAGRTLSLSAWTPWAYLWQDVLVVLLFAGFCHCTRRWPWVGWTTYALLVVYAAINVPVSCTLATPLTWPLLQATRGTLMDSIVHHVSLANIVRLGAVLGSAIALPIVLARLAPKISPRLRAALVVGAFVCLPLGPVAVAHVSTLGLDRNVLVVLVTTALPRVSALDVAGNWHLSPFGNSQAEDLSEYRGAAAGRNVVIIHLESTGAQYLRAYGAIDDPMPNLTRLAKQAILFEHAYTVYPETIKSFFAVQCSIHPALDTRSDVYGKDFGPALATVLRQHNYHTGLFHSGRFMYLGMDAAIQNRGYDTLEDAGDIGGDHESSFGIDEPSAVRRILRWIDDLPVGQRFLVSYLPIAGHHPYVTPKPGPFPVREDVDRYRNALRYADEALDQLLSGLRTRGLDQQTLFVLMGDHGEAFGQHDGNYGHTLFLYEENVRIPYLIVAPGLTRSPTRISRMASAIDTAPTVLDLLGLQVPEGYQGRSLLDGQTNMALFSTDYSLGLLGLRDDRWKFIHELESGRSQLYDLQEDPFEKRNLADLYPERVTAYHDHLLHWAAAQKFRIMK